MKRTVFLGILIGVVGSLHGMEQESNPELQALAQQTRDSDGRLMSVEALMSTYINVEEEGYEQSLMALKEQLKSLSVDFYNEMIPKLVSRGRHTEERALQNMVLALEAINQSLRAINRNMTEGQTLQDEAFTQQVESVKTAKRQFWAAIGGLALTGGGLLVSFVLNLLQANEEV